MNAKHDRDEPTGVPREDIGAKASRRGTESTRELAGKSATELENEIRTIRSDMDATLRELERRFSPSQLWDRALHQLPGGPKEFAGNLGGALRDHPLPAALTGVGLAWLMASSGSPPEGRSQRAGAAREKMRQATHSMSEKFHQVSERMQGGISHARERLHEKREVAGEGMQSARSRAGDVGHEVQARGRHLRESFVDLRREHPVMLAGIGLAVGALIGAALPPTRKEDRLMGEARDASLRQAKEKGQEEAATVEAILHSGVEAAREETERRLH